MHPIPIGILGKSGSGQITGVDPGFPRGANDKEEGVTNEEMKETGKRGALPEFYYVGQLLKKPLDGLI